MKIKEDVLKEEKEELAEVVATELEAIQKNYQQLMQSGEIDNILDAGFEYCNKLAMRKISKVEHKVGLNRKR